MKYLLFLITSLILIACECVPEISTPKIITPENSTDCLFINGIEDNNNIFFETDEISIPGRFPYSKTIPEFKKVKIGNNFIKIRANDSISTIYNAPYNFSKNKKYIYAAAGKSFNIKSLVIEEDTSKSYNFIRSRIINLTAENKPLNITIVTDNNSYEYTINQLSYSNIINLESSNIKMIFVKNSDGGLECSLKDITLLRNNLFVIKGNFNSQNKVMIIDIVSYP